MDKAFFRLHGSAAYFPSLFYFLKYTFLKYSKGMEGQEMFVKRKPANISCNVFFSCNGPVVDFKHAK